jgi:hypothetical protein
VIRVDSSELVIANEVCLIRYEEFLEFLYPVTELTGIQIKTFQHQCRSFGGVNRVPAALSFYIPAHLFATTTADIYARIFSSILPLDREPQPSRPSNRVLLQQDVQGSIHPDAALFRAPASRIQQRSDLPQLPLFALERRADARFRWEYTAGSELFIVYNDTRDTLTSGFPGLQNRSVIAKESPLPVLISVAKSTPNCVSAAQSASVQPPDSPVFRCLHRGTTAPSDDGPEKNRSLKS